MASKYVVERVDLTPDDDEHDEMTEVVKITAPTNLRVDQFAAEISAEAGSPVGLVVDGDPAEASAKTPVLVYCPDGKVSAAALADALRSHRADQDWTEETTEPTLADVKAKAAAGEALTVDEMQVALRALLGADD